jgi:hypothetical protein
MPAFFARTKDMIINSFNRYDINGDSNIDRFEFKLLFTDVCDRLKLVAPEKIHLDEAFGNFPIPNQKLEVLETNYNNLVELQELLDKFDELVKIIIMPGLSNIKALLNEFFDKHGDPPKYDSATLENFSKIFDELSWALVIKPLNKAQLRKKFSIPINFSRDHTHVWDFDCE